MRALICALALCLLGGCSAQAARLPALVSTPQGAKTDIAVDAVNDAAVQYDSVVSGISRGTPVVITGWAVDLHYREAAAGVLALIDGRQPVEATYGGATPQIAAMLHTEHYRAVGYVLTVPTSKLAIGSHRITFYVLAHDRRQYYSTGRIVNVLLVPPSNPRPMVIGDHHHIVGSLDQVTTVDLALEYGREVTPVWLPNKATLFLRGWAIDVIHRQQIVHYNLAIDGRRAAMHAGDLRPELARTFPNVPKIAASYAGFTAVIPLAQYAPGLHQLSLSAVDPKTGANVSLVRTFSFSTYRPTQLAPLVQPRRVGKRPIVLGDGRRLAGSIDTVATVSQSPDIARQRLPVYIDRSDYLFIRGWAVDLQRRKDLPSAWAVIDDRTRYVVTVGEPRVDIVSLYPTLRRNVRLHSGFSVAIPMRGLATGFHRVALESGESKLHARAALIANFPFSVF